MSDDRRKKIEKLLEKKWAANTFALCASVLFFLLVSHINYLFIGIGAVLGFIAPVIYGIIIAYLLNPIMKFFERTVFKRFKHKHGMSVALAFILVFALLGLLIGTLIPSLISSAASITGYADEYYQSVEEFAEENAAFFANFNIDIIQKTNSWEDIVSRIMGSVSSNSEAILAASQQAGKNATNFGLGVILAVYFLMAKRSLLDGVNRLRKLLMKDKTFEEHNVFFARCHKILGSYIGFDVIDGIIVGGINAILMAIFKMPSIALISVAVGVTNLIPTFGPIVGAIIGVFILFLTNPVQALIFLIFTIVIQILDGYIIKPKMFGNTLGVPSVWILIYIIVGGKIFGIAGIFLAIPFAAIFAFVYEENIIPWLHKRKKKLEKAEE